MTRDKEERETIKLTNKRHPELLAMRDFESAKQATQVLKEGVQFFYVTTAGTVPYDVTGPLTVSHYAERNDILWLTALDKNGEVTELAILEFQDDTGKGIFLERADADAYLAAGKEAYKNDPKWKWL